MKTAHFSFNIFILWWTSQKALCPIPLTLVDVADVELTFLSNAENSLLERTFCKAFLGNSSSHFSSKHPNFTFPSPIADSVDLWNKRGIVFKYNLDHSGIVLLNDPLQITFEHIRYRTDDHPDRQTCLRIKPRRHNNTCTRIVPLPLSPLLDVASSRLLVPLYNL